MNRDSFWGYAIGPGRGCASERQFRSTSILDQLETKERLTDLDFIALDERSRANANVIDLRAVGRLQVLDDVARSIVVEPDERVLPTDPLIEERDVGRRISPDDDLLIGERVAHAFEATVQDLEPASDGSVAITH